MRILHVLDHSIPLHSGYAFRTLSILQEQRRLGWQTAHLTSPKHEAAAKALPGYHEHSAEDVEGFTFHRTLGSGGLAARLPVLGQWTVVARLRRRLAEVIETFRPDVLHAHSPSLNGLATQAVARRYDLPSV